MKAPYITYPYPSFKICPNASLPLSRHLQHPPPLLFLWLNGWSYHIWCVILLNDVMNLHMLGLGNLVPEKPWCVFCAIRRQVYWGLIHNVFLTGTLIWYHTRTNTHRHITHWGAKRLTHPYKYIFTPLVLCSQQLCLLQWMDNSLISKVYFPQYLFNSSWLVKVIYLLITCYKTRFFK